MNQKNSSRIEHDKTGQRFFMPVDGKEVVLRYQLKDDEKIDMQSTFTPPELRGRGLARQVVEYALDYARTQDLEVIPTCSYVEKVLAERQQSANQA